MELELDQRYALDRFAFDMLDAGDVVVVGDEPFHLRRIQASIRLRDVDGWHTQVGKDVPRHAIDRQKTCQCNGYDHRQKRDRAPQCK
jgi:hypothetical protein